MIMQRFISQFGHLETFSVHWHHIIHCHTGRQSVDTGSSVLAKHLETILCIQQYSIRENFTIHLTDFTAGNILLAYPFTIIKPYNDFSKVINITSAYFDPTILPIVLNHWNDFSRILCKKHAKKLFTQYYLFDGQEFQQRED